MGEQALLASTTPSTSISSDDSDDFPEFDPLERSWLPVPGEDEGADVTPFTAKPGPRDPPPPDSKPIEYAKLFINDEFVDLLVRETNRYADQWIASHQDYLQEKKFSRVHKWIKVGNTTRQEMYAFLGLVINMGLVQRSTLESYWDAVNPSQRTPYFIEHFNRDRFFLILKFLHFANNEEYCGQDQVFKVEKLIDHFNRLFQRHYHPQKNIFINESTIGYSKESTAPHLPQAVTNKRHLPFGIKLWCLCESRTSYTYIFECFKEAQGPRDRATEGSTHALIMRSLSQSGLLGRGHHLGLNNYFTSPRLLLDLFKENTTATGTVRKGLLPRQVVQADLENKNVFERRKGNLLCVAYKHGSKQQILLSTQESAGFGQTANSRGVKKTRPKIIHLHNETMGRVDMSDAKLHTYLSERRTMKWPIKIAFALIGRAMLNAYVIYNENTDDAKKKTWRQFNISVVEAMVGDYRPPKTNCRPRSHEEIREDRADAETVQGFDVPDAEEPQEPREAIPMCKLQKLSVGKRRQCVNNHPKRVRTSFECQSCNVGLCPECFAEFHFDKLAKHGAYPTYPFS